MSGPSAELIHRIVADLLRGGAPRTSADLARTHLGLGVLDERVADLLLGPALSADPRLERTPSGWVVREPAIAFSSGVAPLAGAFVAAVAPLTVPLATVQAAGGTGTGDVPLLSVAVSGEPEVRRAEERLGRPLPRPIVDLVRVCRRLRGYRGAADALRLAEYLRVPHVEADTPEAHAAVVAATWSALAEDLLAEGVLDTLGLDALLERRLERAELGGRSFDENDLAALDAGPGVYLFRDATGAALYVGQSQNLAARVGSYFAGPPRDEKDRAIRTSAATLETRPVDTAPDALVLEAKWIRRFRPRLNTRLVVRAEATEEGIVALSGPAARGRLVLFVLGTGGLRERIAAAPGPKRVARALDRAVRLLFEPPSGAADAEAGALVDAWRRAHPGTTFVRPAIDGGPDELARAIRTAIID